MNERRGEGRRRRWTRRSGTNAFFMLTLGDVQLFRGEFFKDM
jgi:hypothetical protein